MEPQKSPDLQQKAPMKEGEASHYPHSHAHNHPAIADKIDIRFFFALFILIVVMVAEIIGGILSHSLALMADAGHMVTDVLALSLSLFALYMSHKPASSIYTYGYKRAEVMAALINGVLLFFLAFWVWSEAASRMGQQVVIDAPIMFWIALVGLFANLWVAKLIHHGAEGHLGMKSAFYHVLGDTLGSIGAVFAAVVLWSGGSPVWDLWVSGFIGVLILIGAVNILWESTRLILEAAPKNIEEAELRDFIMAYQEVEDICDLHVWGINSAESILTAHLIINDQTPPQTLLADLLKGVQNHFPIHHITIQFEDGSMEECGTNCSD